MKKIIQTFCLFLLPTFVIGQIEDFFSTPKKSGITLSYFGKNAEYMGANIGIEYEVEECTIIGFQVGTFWDNKNDNKKPDIFVSCNIGIRETFPSGFSPEFNFGLGYLSTFIGKEKNGIRNAKNTPNPEIFFIPSLNLGLLGYDFQPRKNIPVRLFANLLLYWKVSENGNVKTQFQKGIVIGSTYFFK